MLLYTRPEAVPVRFIGSAPQDFCQGPSARPGHVLGMTEGRYRFTPQIALRSKNHALGSQSAFQNFIPPNQAFAFLFQHTLQTMDEITLQLFFILQVLGAFPLLTLGTLCPKAFETLIASYMDILIREKCSNFGKYFIQELEGLFVAHAQGILVDAVKLIANIDGLRCLEAGQLGIGHQCSQTVTGNIDFRNNPYITLTGIGQHFLYIFLRIISAISQRLTRLLWTPRPPVAYTLCTPSSHLSQPGQRLDFNSPALVICQMPVKYIHYVSSG